MQESETLSICPHGAPVKFNCMACTEEAGKNKSLSQFPSAISANLCKHGIYLNMQSCSWCELQSMIDKYSDRLKICEELVIALCDPDKVMANEKNIIERIEKLEKWMGIVHDEFVFFSKVYADPFREMIEDNVNNIFSKIKDIENSDSQKPHKCPLCEGSGKDYSHERIMHGKDAIGYCGEYRNCHACQGKGVIWK